MLKDGSDAGTDDELLNADDREITECLDDADSRLAGEISTSVGADTLRRATDTLYEMDNARFQGDTVDDILAGSTFPGEVHFASGATTTAATVHGPA